MTSNCINCKHEDAAACGDQQLLKTDCGCSCHSGVGNGPGVDGATWYGNPFFGVKPLYAINGDPGEAPAPTRKSR